MPRAVGPGGVSLFPRFASTGGGFREDDARVTGRRAAELVAVAAAGTAECGVEVVTRSMHRIAALPCFVSVMRPRVLASCARVLVLEEWIDARECGLYAVKLQLEGPRWSTARVEIAGEGQLLDGPGVELNVDGSASGSSSPRGSRGQGKGKGKGKGKASPKHGESEETEDEEAQRASAHAESVLVAAERAADSLFPRQLILLDGAQGTGHTLVLPRCPRAWVRVRAEVFAVPGAAPCKEVPPLGVDEVQAHQVRRPAAFGDVLPGIVRGESSRWSEVGVDVCLFSCRGHARCYGGEYEEALAPVVSAGDEAAAGKGGKKVKGKK